MELAVALVPNERVADARIDRASAGGRRRVADADEHRPRGRRTRMSNSRTTAAIQ